MPEATQTSGPANLHVLEKENRILRKKLERLTAEQSKLEQTNDKKESLLRKALEESKAAETALAQQEAELRVLFSAMSDVVLVFDDSGRYVQIAPTNPSLLIQPSHELLGQRLHDALPPETADQFLAQIRQTLATQQPTPLEYGLPIGDRWVWFEGSISPLSSGQVLWMVRDVSDRKIAELERHRTNQRLKAQYAATQVLATAHTLDEAIPALLQTLCIDLDWQLGELWTVDSTIQQLRCTASWQQPSLKLTQFRIATQRYTFASTVGLPGRVWASGTAQWLEHLTEQTFKRANLAAKAGLCSAVGLPIRNDETLLGVFVLYSTQRQLADANLMTILTSMGSQIGQFIKRREAEMALRQSEAQLRQKAMDLEHALKDLQRTQAQLVQGEKMSSLGQLVAGIAHEINNPVNFIYGNISYMEEYVQGLLRVTQLYQDHYPNPDPALQNELDDADLEFLQVDTPRLLNSMRVGADRIKQIVLSLRTFSRMDEAECKAVDIHTGIDSTLMLLEHRLKEQRPSTTTLGGGRPTIQVHKHYGELPLIECYAGQLNQVFMNILANAIDALDEAWEQHNRLPEIAITTEATPTAVVIRIRDNGPGIPEDVQQRLFDPFFTTKPVGKGTGMGLSISYQVVTAKHQGQLQCFSQAGHGTEFVITIPTRL
jgi:two-component system, NtrC family, sensor kinase